MNRITRWFVSVLVFAAVPFIWWITAANWGAEIAGLYSFPRALFNVAVTVVCFSIIYLLLGKMPFKHKVQSASLTVGATTIFLLVIELPALVLGFNYQRLFGGAIGGTALHLSQGVNKPDPTLIQIHWPHSSFAGEVEGNLASLGIPAAPRHSVDVRYDRNGFRNDREFEQADIAVIGDSFVEAAIISREKSLSALLESALGKPTVNLGQIDYGFWQELEVLKRFALPLSPKLVVWVLFGGNDLRDVEAYERRLSDPILAQEANPLSHRLFLRNVFVVAGNVLQNLYQSMSREPRARALNHSGLFRRADGVSERVYYGRTAHPWNAHQWDVAVDTIETAHRLSIEAGAEFVLVYVPRKFRVYRDHLKLSPDHEIARWKVNNLPEKIGKWSEKANIHFVDTTPHLAAIVEGGVHPFFVDDVHWNDLGHAVATKAITEYLSSRRIFPFDGSVLLAE